MASHPPRAHLPPRPLSWWVFALAVAVIVGVYLVGYLWFSAPIPERLPPGDPASAQGASERYAAELELVRLRGEARRNALIPTGAVAGAFGLWLALHRQRHAEYEQYQREQDQQRSHEQRERADAASQEDALQRRITDARIRAVEQLGSQDSMIRIGGLHNLERLGEIHPEQRQVIIDQLCSYLRQPYRPPRPAPRPRLDRRLFEPVGPAPAAEPGDEGEQEVRLLAQEILERHLRSDLGDEHWRHRRLNLRGANLAGLDLTGASIREANFAGATFTGAFRLAKARFEGDASFAGAAFTGPVDLQDAVFGAMANFRGAVFSGPVNATSAEFEGKADFEGALFKGIARFDETRFADHANFDRVKARERVLFTRTRFDGRTSFGWARFASAASFEFAVFTGSAGFWDAVWSGHGSFRGTVFKHYAEFSRVQFATAKFEGTRFGGSAEFGRAVFNGRTEFKQAAFAGTANFSETRFSGPVDFVAARFPIGVIFNAAAFAELPAFGRAQFGGLIGIDDVRLPQSVPGAELLDLLTAGAVFGTSARHLLPKQWRLVPVDEDADRYRLERRAPHS